MSVTAVHQGRQVRQAVPVQTAKMLALLPARHSTRQTFVTGIAVGGDGGVVTFGTVYGESTPLWWPR